MGHFVQLLQKRDRFQAFTAAKRIRNPLAFLAAVIEIKHGGDGIDAQAVQVEFAQPVERIGKQEIANFVTAIIENVSAPVGVLAFAWIFVFVERRAVESSQGESILRKM